MISESDKGVIKAELREINKSRRTFDDVIVLAQDGRTRKMEKVKFYHFVKRWKSWRSLR